MLDGAPPYPVSVALADGTRDNATYGLGDLLELVVTFDKNVTIDGGSVPVLVLDCTRMREATYDRGNDSTALIFQYEVRWLSGEIDGIIAVVCNPCGWGTCTSVCIDVVADRLLTCTPLRGIYLKDACTRLKCLRERRKEID